MCIEVTSNNHLSAYDGLFLFAIAPSQQAVISEGAKVGGITDEVTQDDGVIKDDNLWHCESVGSLSLFLSRHRSAETQCWMRRYVRSYVVRTSLFAMRPRKCCMHALHP